MSRKTKDPNTGIITTHPQTVRGKRRKKEVDDKKGRNMREDRRTLRSLQHLMWQRIINSRHKYSCCQAKK